MLAGFRAMDEHFQASPFESNLPALLGLLGVWYVNFFQDEIHAILMINTCGGSAPFASSLTWSNGKRVTLDGTVVDYQTGPIIWGQPVTNGQHAYIN